MSKITSVRGREILNSKGHPTLWVELILNDRFKGIGQVPSGASKGINEAIEKQDMNGRYGGRGVLNAVNVVNQKIFNALVGKKVFCIEDVDRILLSMDDDIKSNLGANSTIGVSIAAVRALANEANQELYQYLSQGKPREFFIPVPFVNVVNGGCHARNSLMIQEFMIVPFGFNSFSEAIRCACEVFYALGDLCKVSGVGDEGGYAPDLKMPEEALDLLMQSIEKAGYKAGEQVNLALDVAASELFQNDGYQVHSNKILSRGELVSLYQSLCNKYPLISIEDPMDQNDAKGWKEITQSLQIQIVGDDLFCTRKNLLQEGVKQQHANAILIKPNQVGTITETLETVEFAQSCGYKVMVSHRSGETGDTTISDLAVATDAMQIKAGSVCRFERVAKYNRILEIEENLGKAARYAGEVLKWT